MNSIKVLIYAVRDLQETILALSAKTTEILIELEILQQKTNGKKVQPRIKGTSVPKEAEPTVAPSE